MFLSVLCCSACHDVIDLEPSIENKLKINTIKSGKIANCSTGGSSI